MNILRNNIKNVINRWGYDIRKISGKNLRWSLDQSYKHLVDRGFLPKVIIDVGAANGSFDLYQNFPSAYYILIEPLKENEKKLNEVLKTLNGILISAAASNKNGYAKLFVDQSHLNGSSLFQELRENITERKIETVRIDDILNKNKIENVDLLKIDVQGAELDVLEGCPKTLKNSEIVVLEVSLIEFSPGQPQIFEVLSYMKNYEFVAYDIILGWNRGIDNALAQINIVFVKENSRYRK